VLCKRMPEWVLFNTIIPQAWLLIGFDRPKSRLYSRTRNVMCESLPSLAQTLYGQTESEELGRSITLSMDRMTLAVGADGTEAKGVRVYINSLHSGCSLEETFMLKGRARPPSVQQWLYRATG
jgi:hypothetical protein